MVQVVLGGATIGALLYFGTSLMQKVSTILKDPETQKMLETMSIYTQNKISQLDQASEYIQERLPPTSQPMYISDHLVEILTVLDEPLLLEDIFLFLLARGYQPKGTSDNSKRYVLSVLKRHAMFTGSSWQLVETPSRERYTLVGSSSG